MSDPKKVKKEVKGWAVVGVDGKIESFLRSLNVAETRDRARFIAFSNRSGSVVPCTITYEVER